MRPSLAEPLTISSTKASTVYAEGVFGGAGIAWSSITVTPTNAPFFTT
jgi:hypothetical protein